MRRAGHLFRDQVQSQPPYAAHGQRDTRNNQDGIFLQGGDQLLLQVQPGADGQSYTATMAVGVDLSAPSQSGPGPGPGPGGPPRSGA